MSDVETHADVNFSDLLISSLAAVTFAGAAFGLTLAAFAGIDYAVTTYQLSFGSNPQFTQGMTIGQQVLPGLLAVVVALVTYRRVLRLN